MFFELMKVKIQAAMTTIRLVVFAVLVVLGIGAMSTCTHYKNQVSELQAEKAKTKLENEAEKLKLITLAQAKELRWANERIEANERYTQEINAVHALYAGRQHDVDGVRNSITETIKYLPGYTLEECQSFATAAGYSVIEGAALLVEVEAVARQYSAEIDKLIREHPGEWPNGAKPSGPDPGIVPQDAAPPDPFQLE